MAELARAIRDRIQTALAIETKSGPLTKLLTAFQESLVHDLDEDGFADMYAQTIAYGLLSSRITDPQKKTADDFAAHMRTNPFLKELMETFLHLGGRKGKAGGPGIDFDELGVTDVVELLDDANMEEVIRDFGDEKPEEDPVIHFYELFLQKYDAKKRMQRGVFYTPRPVVSFIVRSADEVLMTEFGLEDGLADVSTWRQVAERISGIEIPAGTSPDQPFVQILDPATGTGTFLVEVIDLIHKRMSEKWRAAGHAARKIEQLWNEYVPERLLPRLHGYELMMAPYAIAHMKIGLKLYETGYHFESDQRAQIFLTNSLTAPLDETDTLFPDLDALAVEAAAAKASKSRANFTIIIGNPPYSNFSANLSSDARELVARFKQIDGRPLQERNALQLERNVNDDYVKFLAIALDYRAKSCGIISYITNSSFYDAATLRGLRANLLAHSSSIWLYDIGGSPDLSGGSSSRDGDQNVFDITQPVAISLFCQSSPPRDRLSEVSLARLRGSRDSKYDALSSSMLLDLEFERVSAISPMFTFSQLPHDDEWRVGVPINECLSIYAEGLKTGFDAALISFDRDEFKYKIGELAEHSAEEIRGKYSIGTTGWASKLTADAAETSRLATDALHDQPVRFQYRPLDFRYICWPSKLLKASSVKAGRHLIADDNICLLAARQISGPDNVTHFLVARRVPDNRIFYSKKGSATYFPIWNVEGGSNFTDEFKSWFVENLSRSWVDARDSDSQTDVNPNESLSFIYALFHSPTYRRRYSQQLMRDWPRVFAPCSDSIFNAMCVLGSELVRLHLMEEPSAAHSGISVIGSDFQVKKVSYSDETVWLDENRRNGFSGISEDVWLTQLGGYQVCEKWLKDRQTKGGKSPQSGRVLTEEDIDHYKRIVVTVVETSRIMAEIDGIIDQHGGWPDAFLTDKNSSM